MKNSHLYQLLKFCQKFENGFTNVNEIYFFMYGYSSFMNQPNTSKILYEEWIDEFHFYISQELKILFFPDGEIRNVHFGIIINEFVEDRKLGVELFFKILDTFAMRNNENIT